MKCPDCKKKLERNYPNKDNTIVYHYYCTSCERAFSYHELKDRKTRPSRR